MQSLSFVCALLKSRLCGLHYLVIMYSLVQCVYYHTAVYSIISLECHTMLHFYNHSTLSYDVQAKFGRPG